MAQTKRWTCGFRNHDQWTPGVTTTEDSTRRSRSQTCCRLLSTWAHLRRTDAKWKSVSSVKSSNQTKQIVVLCLFFLSFTQRAHNTVACRNLHNMLKLFWCYVEQADRSSGFRWIRARVTRQPLSFLTAALDSLKSSFLSSANLCRRSCRPPAREHPPAVSLFLYNSFIFPFPHILSP